MKHEPLVSVIILNWDRPQETMALLADLRRQTYPNREIILVDNASNDGLADEIEDRYRDIKVVRAAENLGVPGGRNLGIEHAGGELLFFLDNDALVEPEGISKIVDVFDQYPNLGIISLRIDDHNTGKLDLGSWIYAKAQLPRAGERFPAYSFCGCGFAVRHKLFAELGLFQGGFFFCGEEDEFAIRAIKREYDIQYCGDIAVWHKTSPRRRQQGAGRLIYCFRNRLLTIWAYYPLWHAVRITLFRVAVYAEKGRGEGSFAVVPRGILQAIRLWRRLGLHRNPMDKEAWRRYRHRYVNLGIRWWQWKRIRQEFGGSRRS